MDVLGKTSIGPREIGDVVYNGTKLYSIPEPEASRNDLRGVIYDPSTESTWYFSKVEIPCSILEKIVKRLNTYDKYSMQPLITIRLKQTPLKGFKKNVVYKRYSSSLWTLTNKNGREATAVELGF